MSKTRAFIDFDGTITWLSGDEFIQKFRPTLEAMLWRQSEKTILDGLLKKEAAGEMKELIKPGVVETLAKLQPSNRVS